MLNTLYLRCSEALSELWASTERRTRRQEGQGMVEYALILVLIAVIAIGVIAAVGTRVSATFSRISCGLQSPPPPGGCP